MNTYQPYTYLIGWSHLELWYYGVRYAKNCHPSDFWSKYFTSSSYVSEIRRMHGEPDVIQIRRKFNSANKAMLWEQKVLRRLNAANSIKWINKTNGQWPPMEQSQEIRNMISMARKGIPRTISTKAKLSIANQGKTISEEQRTKISTAMKERWNDPDYRERMSIKRKEAAQNRKHSTTTKEKMSASASRRWSQLSTS